MREVVFITSIVLSILEIWLSIKLILRKKNNYAQTSEILLSFVVQSLYLEALHVNWWKIIICILVQYIGVKFFLLIFMIAAKLGVDTTSVAAIIASGGVAIGLALQGSLSNFAGGVLILLLKPFEVGDYIIEDTNHNEGTVKEIQIFYTKLSTVDNKTIVIPNGMLTNNSLTNATAKAERKLDLKVDIAYEADLRKAKAVIEEIIRQDDATIKNEEILVFVHELAESSVVIGARAWVKNEDYWNARWRILEEIKLKLDENEIEMAYPHLTVQMGKEN